MALASRPASASGTLYGAGPDGFLITIDVATGAGTLVGTFPPVCPDKGHEVTEIEFSNLSRRAFAQCGGTSFAGFEFALDTAGAIGSAVPNGASFTGLEAVGAVWYGTSVTTGGGSGPSRLATIDPFTGAVTPIGATGVAAPLSGLAFEKRKRTMYAIAGGPGPADLYTVDLRTGAATAVGSTGIQAGSLEFGPDGRLYAGGGGADAGKLYVVDPATGASTLVGESGFGTLSGLMLVEPDCTTDEANPVRNCSFEASFMSWVTQDHPDPFFPLSVLGADISIWPTLFTSAPTQGDLAVLNGWDGGKGSPSRIRVGQNVAIPGGGLLEFDYRAGWDLATFCVDCSDRVFSVQVEPAGGGAPLTVRNILTARAGTSVPDTGDRRGSVDLGAFAGRTVRLVFDWLVPDSFTGPAAFQLDNVRVETPNGFFTVPPCRLVDTRRPDGPTGGPALVAGADRSFTIAGRCAIPRTAKAIAVSIAVTDATQPGRLHLRADGTAVPVAISISYGAAQTRSNNGLVALSPDGGIAVFATQAAGTVHLILEVTGYFQ
jgi:hypothetical protein